MIFVWELFIILCLLLMLFLPERIYPRESELYAYENVILYRVCGITNSWKEYLVEYNLIEWYSIYQWKLQSTKQVKLRFGDKTIVIPFLTNSDEFISILEKKGVTRKN